MKLRPGRTVRKINSQSWARYSLKKPRKNFIKALPRTSLLIFNMGDDSPSFDTSFALTSKEKIQLRSNALEAARQSANKYLERELPGAFYMRVITFPHNVLREKKFALGAGADRLSQGMTLSFGRPSALAARIKKGQSVFVIKTAGANKLKAREALRRASSKLSGSYSIVITEPQKSAPAKSA